MSTTSTNLEVFTNLAQVLQIMLKRESSVEPLALLFAGHSTRLFGKGDFEGGYESFSRVKSMFKMAREELEYATYFYNYMVEERALEEKRGDFVIEESKKGENYATKKQYNNEPKGD